MDHVNIYIATTFRAFDRDGAYVYILECFRDGEAVTRERHGMLRDTTRNRAALQVLLMAVAKLTKRVELSVYSDNSYLALFSQAKKWKEAGWRRLGGEPVANAEEWGRLLEVLPEDAEVRTGERHTYLHWMERRAEQEKREQGDGMGKPGNSKDVQGGEGQEEADRDPHGPDPVQQEADHSNLGRGGSHGEKGKSA